MDYSMILFKVTKPKEYCPDYNICNHNDMLKCFEDKATNEQKSMTGIESKKILDTQYYWHIGIIDYLQDYNINKKIERCYKRFKSPNSDPSSLAPKPYAKRFKKFWETCLITPG
jgi:hypothetical protein